MSSNSSLLFSFKYQVKDHLKSIAAFYAILAAIVALSFFISNAEQYADAANNFTGNDVASIFFLFIAGLCTFKEPFLFFMQNNIPRVSLLKGKLLTAFSICAIVASVSSVLSAFLHSKPEFSSLSIYYYAFSSHTEKIPFILKLIENFFATFFLSMCFYMFGYFITILYYRMNSRTKAIFSVFAPLTLFLVIPAIDSILLSNAIANFLVKLTMSLSGIPSQNPYILILSTAAASALITSVCWFMVRRIPVNGK